MTTRFSKEPTPYRRDRMVTNHQREKMRRMREEGHELRAIARMVDKPRSTVYEHVKDIPWPLKK